MKEDNYMGKVSLHRNINNVGKMAHNFRIILAVITACVILGSSLTISGCGFPKASAVVAAADTPAATQKVLPTPERTPTAVPTPTEKPTPTPMPELTQEQKELLLGINDKFHTLKVKNINIFCFELDEQKFITWTYSILSREDHGYKHYQIFNGTYLFSVSFENTDIESQELYKYVSTKSSLLNNAEFIGSCALPSIPTRFKKLGIKYDGNELIDKFHKDSYNMSDPDPFKKDIQTILTKDDLIYLYLDTTPQENIPPFWIYTEGATIPDELIGIYTNGVIPTPAPTFEPAK